MRLSTSAADAPSQRRRRVAHVGPLKKSASDAWLITASGGGHARLTERHQHWSDASRCLGVDAVPVGDKPVAVVFPAWRWPPVSSRSRLGPFVLALAGSCSLLLVCGQRCHYHYTSAGRRTSPTMPPAHAPRRPARLAACAGGCFLASWVSAWWRPYSTQRRAGRARHGRCARPRRRCRRGLAPHTRGARSPPRRPNTAARTGWRTSR